MDVQQFAVNMRQKFSFTSQCELPDRTTYRWKLKKQYLQLPVSLNVSGNLSLTHLNKQALKLQKSETQKVQILRRQAFNLILTELTPLASAVKQLKNTLLTFSYES